jgi:hypothetical protein
MVYFFKTPLPKAGQSTRFASSPAKSGSSPAKSSRQLLGPTNLKSTVGQYSRTDHSNTVRDLYSTVVRVHFKRIILYYRRTPGTSTVPGTT